jgi:hypothetical protein
VDECRINPASRQRHFLKEPLPLDLIEWDISTPFRRELLRALQPQSNVGHVICCGGVDSAENKNQINSKQTLSTMKKSKFGLNENVSQISCGGAVIRFATTAAAVMLLARASSAQSFSFNTGEPDGLMAAASRPPSENTSEIEAADDFNLNKETSIHQATFTGLLPAGTTLSNITEVAVEIYHVFPKDSVLPPDGRVRTRTNSPSDIAFDSRDSIARSVREKLTFEVEVLADSFTASNSVLNGINPLPDVTTRGEGPVSGMEVRFEVTFPFAFDLPADHYFFIPQVKLDNGEFFWLSAARPIVGAGTTPLAVDLQSWIRNEELQPDWLRIGTDIVGGTPAPTFNASFSLHGKICRHHDDE